MSSNGGAAVTAARTARRAAVVGACSLATDIVRYRSARFIESHDLTVDYRFIGHCSQGLNDGGVQGQPLRRFSLLEDHTNAKLEPIGLGWVNFKVLRRTQASLGHKAKVDPKVAADQRGHGIGVALDVYTKSSIEERAAAVKQLEEAG